jgi:hypothetical protein
MNNFLLTLDFQKFESQIFFFFFFFFLQEIHEILSLPIRNFLHLLWRKSVVQNSEKLKLAKTYLVAQFMMIDFLAVFLWTR